MRIDFAASYRDVSRLLKASSQPASPQAQGATFEQNLQGELVNPGKTLGDLPEPKGPAALVSQPAALPDGIKAMLKLEGFEPEPSLMTPHTPSEVGPVQEPELSESVKTPTLVDVKRVTIEREVPDGAKLSQLGAGEIRARLRTVSEKIGVDPSLAMAVVKAESSFNSKAVSNDGHSSKGLFQLLDTTGKFLLSKEGTTEKKYDPFDPDLNMQLGTSYLKYLHEIFGSSTELPNKLRTRKANDPISLEKFAVASFNAGEGRVASAQHRSEKAGRDPGHYDQVAPFLPRSTREYVARVLQGKKLF